MGSNNFDITFVPVRVTRTQARQMIKETLNKPTDLKNRYIVKDKTGNQVYFN